MRVKVGDTWYTSDEQPICIELSEAECAKVIGMNLLVRGKRKHAVLPNARNMTAAEVEKWMEG